MTILPIMCKSQADPDSAEEASKDPDEIQLVEKFQGINLDELESDDQLGAELDRAIRQRAETSFSGLPGRLPIPLGDRWGLRQENINWLRTRLEELDHRRLQILKITGNSRIGKSSFAREFCGSTNATEQGMCTVYIDLLGIDEPLAPQILNGLIEVTNTSHDRVARPVDQLVSVIANPKLTESDGKKFLTAWKDLHRAVISGNGIRWVTIFLDHVQGTGTDDYERELLQLLKLLRNVEGQSVSPLPSFVLIPHSAEQHGTSELFKHATETLHIGGLTERDKDTWTTTSLQLLGLDLDSEVVTSCSNLISGRDGDRLLPHLSAEFAEFAELKSDTEQAVSVKALNQRLTRLANGSPMAETFEAIFEKRFSDFSDNDDDLSDLRSTLESLLEGTTRSAKASQCDEKFVDALLHDAIATINAEGLVSVFPSIRKADLPEVEAFLDAGHDTVDDRHGLKLLTPRALVQRLRKRKYLPPKSRRMVALNAFVYAAAVIAVAGALLLISSARQNNRLQLEAKILGNVEQAQVLMDTDPPEALVVASNALIRANADNASPETISATAMVFAEARYRLDAPLAPVNMSNAPGIGANESVTSVKTIRAGHGDGSITSVGYLASGYLRIGTASIGANNRSDVLAFSNFTHVAEGVERFALSSSGAIAVANGFDLEIHRPEGGGGDADLTPETVCRINDGHCGTRRPEMRIDTCATRVVTLEDGSADLHSTSNTGWSLTASLDGSLKDGLDEIQSDPLVRDVEFLGPDLLVIAANDKVAFVPLEPLDSGEPQACEDKPAAMEAIQSPISDCVSRLSPTTLENIPDRSSPNGAGVSVGGLAVDPASELLAVFWNDGHVGVYDCHVDSKGVRKLDVSYSNDLDGSPHFFEFTGNSETVVVAHGEELTILSPPQAAPDNDPDDASTWTKLTFGVPETLISGAASLALVDDAVLAPSGVSNRWVALGLKPVSGYTDRSFVITDDGHQGPPQFIGAQQHSEGSRSHLNFRVDGSTFSIPSGSDQLVASTTFHTDPIAIAEDLDVVHSPPALLARSGDSQEMTEATIVSADGENVAGDGPTLTALKVASSPLKIAAVSPIDKPARVVVGVDHPDVELLVFVESTTGWQSEPIHTDDALSNGIDDIELTGDDQLYVLSGRRIFTWDLNVSGEQPDNPYQHNSNIFDIAVSDQYVAILTYDSIELLPRGWRPGARPADVIFIEANTVTSIFTYDEGGLGIVRHDSVELLDGFLDPQLTKKYLCGLRISEGKACRSE